MSWFKNTLLTLSVGVCWVFPAFAGPDDITLTPGVWYDVALRSSSTDSGGQKASDLSTTSFGIMWLTAAQPYNQYETAAVLALSADDTNGAALYELYGKLSREGVTYKLGMFDPSDTTVGLKNLPLKNDDTFFGMILGPQSYVGVDLTNLGLSVLWGSHTVNHQADADDSSADAATVQTSMALYFEKEFGNIALAADFGQITNKNDVNKGPSAAALAAGDYYDRMTGLGFAWASGSVGFGLQGEILTNHLDSRTDDEVTTHSNLSFDLNFSERSGLGLAVTQLSLADGSANPTLTQRSQLGLVERFNNLQAVTMLYSVNTKDADDETLDIKETGLVVGMHIEF
ncbi:MAG: hypothetical protein A2508_08425 [Candidatus Lambdaproteobacteria bacterium RIFOXYD12_FULL_49_8]|nr:MAG: hypothetical protein A2508_08425 [Candidatus Lambdaproteobacteria bacterium RIFOXYD12_FULL_49_8]